MRNDTVQYNELSEDISFHLATRFFPPLPHDYVEPLMEAIACAHEEVDQPVFLDQDIEPRPRLAVWDEDSEAWRISSVELIDICRAWNFV